jgi:hypothetical protein
MISQLPVVAMGADEEGECRAQHREALQHGGEPRLECLAASRRWQIRARQTAAGCGRGEDGEQSRGNGGK